MRCRNYSADSLGIIIIVVLVVGFVEISLSKPADKTSTSTTEKPIKHPSYVRVLKRGRGNDTVTDVTEEELKDAVVVIPGNGTEPQIKVPDRQLSADEIRGIIPFLNFQNNGASSDRTSVLDSKEKPRTGLLDIFSRVFESFRGIGEARGRSNGGRGASRTRDSGENGNGTATRTTGRANEGSARGPGGFIAGIMKALQNMTITVESMVMSFVKLFDLSSSRNKV